MGGGRRYFLDNATKDPESERVEKHHRRDGLNLVEVGLYCKKKSLENSSFLHRTLVNLSAYGTKGGDWFTQ